MVRYRHNFIAAGTYFFTVILADQNIEAHFNRSPSGAVYCYWARNVEETMMDFGEQWG